MKRYAQFLGLALAILPFGCQSAGPASSAKTGRAQIFRGMGTHHRSITTSSDRAQQFFDQGLIWAYAFNHDEAIRSFTECTKIDPNCSMCWWGVALCNGPHINNPVMPPERSKAAWDAAQRAMALKNLATPVERALIDAVAKRYADPAPEDRKSLDEAYAAAMREVWKAYPNDADVGTLFAEAMMDLRPWDLWKKGGSPQDGTDEIITALDRVRTLNPDHPGALHLYIHTVEASPAPERGITAADRLRNLVPASGHLLHMPSHIDVLTGQWAKASDQNERAISADRAYRKLAPRQDFYRVYMAHNHHMLMFAAMMEGRCDVSIRAARDMIDSIPDDYLRTQTALVDPIMGSVLGAQMRFGRWDDILKAPKPQSFLPITTAMWRFARGVAYAAKGQIADAEHEQTAFRAAAAAVPEGAMMSINPAKNVLDVAEHMLAGEIALRRGSIDDAVDQLNKAIKLESNLIYMEPPEWIQPVRHTLGAILVDARRFDEAEKVYRADLNKWPENGWSLFGLEKCLRAKGASNEADEVAGRFKKVWSRADTTIETSCLCVKGKG